MLLLEKFFLWVLGHERVISGKLALQSSHASLVQDCTSSQWFIHIFLFVRIHRLGHYKIVSFAVKFKWKLIFDGRHQLLLRNYMRNEIVVFVNCVLVGTFNWWGEPFENEVQLVEDIKSLFMIVHITDGNVFHIELI